MSAVVQKLLFSTLLVLLVGLILGVLPYLPPPLGMAKNVTSSTDLVPSPQGADVYFLGNSMFGTGIDMDIVSRQMPGVDARLAYYDGHYSSMWYLASRLSFNVEDPPGVVVWGFRSTYAIAPAFRQNRRTVQTDFEMRAPKRYLEILANAGGEPLINKAQGERYTDAVEVSSEPFEELGGWAGTTLLDMFPIMRQRQTTSANVKDFFNRLMRKFVGAVSSIELFDRQSEPLRADDLFVAHVSGGEILRADALVVDAGEKFVQGIKVPFNESFIPETTVALRKLGIPQVVVIFKPRGVFSGSLKQEVLDFNDDALEYFQKNDIPFVNFVADEDLTEKFFAKGDHYNQAGREYVTNRIIEKLMSLKILM